MMMMSLRGSGCLRNNLTNTTRHEKIASLVRRMLELHKRSPKTPHEQEMVKREVEPSADRAIDRLVYELSHKGMIYGLTEDEVRIVDMYKAVHSLLYSAVLYNS